MVTRVSNVMQNRFLNIKHFENPSVKFFDVFQHGNFEFEVGSSENFG